MTLFYQPDLDVNHLTQEDSHHAIRVLRMGIGDAFELTDGHGTILSAKLTSTEPSSAGFSIVETRKVPSRTARIHLAIAPTKNIDRMEWMVEKVTEIGVDKISFVRCKTSERPGVPIARLQKIAISAMKQSRQAWLPELADMIPLKDFLAAVSESQRLIAHVDNTNPDHLANRLQPNTDCVLLVGPEGDFTREELSLATGSGFTKVSLGANRLRTETAGVYGVAIIAGKQAV